MSNSQFCAEKNSIVFEESPEKQEASFSSGKCRNKELVMYMSNLPGFLQHGRQNSVLNFGVLDWSKLEKWNNTESMAAKASSTGEAKTKLNLGSDAPTSCDLISNENISAVSISNESTVSHECCKLDEEEENRLSDFHSSHVSYAQICSPESYILQNDATYGTIKDNMVCSNFHEDEKSIYMIQGKLIDEFVAHSEFVGKPAAKGKAPTLLCKLRRILQRMSKGYCFRNPSSIQVLSSPEVPSTAGNRLRCLLNRTMAETASGTKRYQKRNVVQALLQLTLKNDLPVYKLVVGTSNSIMIAAAKKSQISEKLDQSLTYIFYSVCNIKKKSKMFMSKGCSKACSLVYNIIGQMEISTASDPEVSCNKYAPRECVLYSADHQSKQSANEIAAIITNSSSKKNATVVILPGAVHSIPIKGTPSSLISRWRSGGACDCGGWDIGCKLKVLDQSHESSKVLYNDSSLKLFLQGHEHQNKPMFTMEPLKHDLYSVAFDDSIPLLEAFAICVAQITCKACIFLEYDSVKDTKEALEMQHGSFKYSSSSCPPMSPASRI